MSAKTAEALETNEVLEQILLQLDIRTLLTTAQRVNHHWHTLIATSPALQQALYLEPCLSRVSEVQLNPLLKEAFPFWFDSEGLSDHEEFFELPLARADQAAKFMRPDASWRRMLPRQPRIAKECVWKQRHNMGGDSHAFTINEFVRDKEGVEPVSAIEKAQRERAVSTKPRELRMGELYDQVIAFFSSNRVARFAVYWDPAEASHNTDAGFWGRSLNSEKHAELEEMAAQADYVLKLFITVQCTGAGRHSSRFDHTFIFPTAER